MIDGGGAGGVKGLTVAFLASLGKVFWIECFRGTALTSLLSLSSLSWIHLQRAYLRRVPTTIAGSHRNRECIATAWSVTSSDVATMTKIEGNDVRDGSRSDEETVIGHFEDKTGTNNGKVIVAGGGEKGAEGRELPIDPVIEKRVLRKLDLYLTPLVGFLCMFGFFCRFDVRDY